MNAHELCQEWIKGKRWYGSDNSREVCGTNKAAVMRYLNKPEKWFEANGVLCPLADEIVFRVVGTIPYSRSATVQADNVEDLTVEDLILIGRLLRRID